MTGAVPRLRPKLLMFGIVAMALALSISEVAARSCRVPAALLCAGCAQSIKLTLLSNGQCRVSFETARATPGEAAAARDIEIEIQPSRPSRTFGARPLEQRLRAAKRVRRIAIVRRAALAPGPRCFEFSGRRYCE